jgi:hypothetical protein
MAISKVYIHEEFGNKFIRAEYENTSGTKSIMITEDKDIDKIIEALILYRDNKLVKNG